MRRRDILGMIGGAPAALALRRRAQAQQADSLTYAQSTAVLTLDPVHGGFTLDPGGYEAALCLYDGLLNFEPSMQIVPQLASGFRMASDLRSCRLTLRSPVRFHDGTTFDAAAARFNLERLADPARNPTNRSLWDPIAGIETPDARTVVVRLSRPFSQFPNSLAHASGAMVSPAAVATYGENGVARNPVGAGPYRVTQFDPGRRVVMAAFDRYWDGAPRTRRLVFTAIAEPARRVAALRTGAADVIDAVPVELAAALGHDPGLRIFSSPGLRSMGFAINLARATLADRRVRQALNLAVPVQTIADKLFLGYAQVPISPLAPNTMGYASVSRLVYDPARAKSLLAAAGYRPEAPLELIMYVSDGLYSSDVALGDVVANALRQIDVRVRITKVESGAYLDALRQDRASVQWDLALFGFNPSNASGLYQLESLFRSNNDDAARPDAWNIGRYRNPEIDALLEQAAADPDPAHFATAMQRAQRIIWHDAPYIWLQINDNVAAVRDRISGVELWPVGFTVMRRARA